MTDSVEFELDGWKVKKPRKITNSATYSVRQIVDLKVIPTYSKASSTVYRLQRHIRQGLLKASNIGTEKRPIYAVTGKDLKDYLKERYDLSFD